MKNYSFSVLAIGLAISIAGFSKKASQQWLFIGTCASEITDYTKYALNRLGEGCIAVGDIPCIISAPESIDTPAELQFFFIGKSAADIMDLASFKHMSDCTK